MKTSLIMEGGAMRGMFTCGVIDVLMEHNITFDGAAGISAGVCFGCNYKSHQIGRAVRYNKKYARDPRYCSFRSLIKTGNLYGADFCYKEIPDKLDPFDRETFRNNPMHFYLEAIDIMTGEGVFHEFKDGEENDMEWMRASASMPVVSRPVAIDGRLLLDGGVVEGVPYDYMKSLGYNRNVLVMTRPKGFRKEKLKHFMLIRFFLRKYPKLVEALATMHERYNRQMDIIDRDEERGEILVIRPQEGLAIKRTESSPEELERVYQLGRREMERRLAEVENFLSPKGIYSDIANS